MVLPHRIGDNRVRHLNFPRPWVWGLDASKKEEKKAMERLRADYAKHPSGLLVYGSPGSRQFNFGKFLTVEFYCGTGGISPLCFSCLPKPGM